MGAPWPVTAFNTASKADLPYYQIPIRVLIIEDENSTLEECGPGLTTRNGNCQKLCKVELFFYGYYYSQ